jgi:hypothetical protein
MHGKTTSAKRNSGRKSTLAERDCHTFRRTVSKNHTITAIHETAELNIHLEHSVSTAIVQCELHKFNIGSRAQITKLLITESNAQMCVWCCYDNKNFTWDNWKCVHDMVIFITGCYLRSGSIFLMGKCNVNMPLLFVQKRWSLSIVLLRLSGCMQEELVEATHQCYMSFIYFA